VDDAIQRGLQFDLSLLESQTACQIARAERIEVLSAPLPQVTGTLWETGEQLNLKTLGFNFAPNPYLTIPSIVGLSHYGAIQANVFAKVLDWNARRNLKSARANEQAAALSVQRARDRVVQAVANAIGLGPDEVFHLADSVSFFSFAGISEEQALRIVLEQGPDYQTSGKLVEAAQQAVAAARAEWYPTLDLNGFYGATGLSFFNSPGVFSITGALNFNIIIGGRIHADIEKARATLPQRSDELADQDAQLEMEVCDASLDLQSAADQVALARDNLVLANPTLDQSRDRFSFGVTDNVEVVPAQGAVATANENLIAALYAHNLAKVSLTRALAEQGIRNFIEAR
jgi:outer membrane protein TolC